VSKSRHVHTAADGTVRTFFINILHLFTPARQDSIRYWWFVSRDFRLVDDELDGFLAKGVDKAFNEDRVALEAIQALKNAAGDRPLPELSFGPDRGGMLMRKLLLRLAEQEAT
jgi:Vanillate O-demethylase oxygenase C-terminal domain